MPAKIPTAEELKKLTAEERVKVLKQLEEARKKELEEEQKRVEQEIAAAEELIKETESESREETERDREKDQEKETRRREEEQSLEERVGKERATAQLPVNDKQYGTGPTNLYKTLENDITELDRLYGKREWDDRDKQAYQEAKEHIDTVQQYKIGSERLAEEFGLAMGTLNRLKYR